MEERIMICGFLAIFIVATATADSSSESKSSESSKSSKSSKSAESSEVECPSGFSVYENRCYAISTDDTYTWEEGKTYCGSLAVSATLPCPGNKDEREFIKDLFTTMENIGWLGINDAETEGEWWCLDTSPQTYLHWKKDHPAENDVTRNCVIIDNGKYIDRDCEDQYQAVCVLDPLVTTTIHATTPEKATITNQKSTAESLQPLTNPQNDVTGQMETRSPRRTFRSTSVNTLGTVRVSQVDGKTTERLQSSTDTPDSETTQTMQAKTANIKTTSLGTIFRNDKTTIFRIETIRSQQTSSLASTRILDTATTADEGTKHGAAETGRAVTLDPSTNQTAQPTTMKTSLAISTNEKSATSRKETTGTQRTLFASKRTLRTEPNRVTTEDHQTSTSYSNTVQTTTPTMRKASVTTSMNEKASTIQAETSRTQRTLVVSTRTVDKATTTKSKGGTTEQLQPSPISPNSGTSQPPTKTEQRSYLMKATRITETRREIRGTSVDVSRTRCTTRCLRDPGCHAFLYNVAESGVVTICTLLGENTDSVTIHSVDEGALLFDME